MPFLGAAGLGGLVAFLKVGAKPTVLGGVLSEDSTYYYRTFFGSSTLTVTGGVLPADILVVAGGASGGGDRGGGGGAGGYLSFTSQSLAPTSYSITVGAGGAANLSNYNNGYNGSNSTFPGLTTAIGGGAGGGGGGGGTLGLDGSSGGSGGGGGAADNVQRYGGAGTAGQGNAGGNPDRSQGSYNAGGGGGAGAAGANYTTASGGAGGVGLQWLNGSYYAGGGGGGTAVNVAGNAPGAAGGNGGGGKGAGVGSGSSPAVAGSPNTGGGGGGSNNTTYFYAAAGGSGVVIVRYRKTDVPVSTDAYELIGTITLTSAQASVTFSGLPSSEYKHLQLRAVTRNSSTNGGSSTYGANGIIRFNGDSTSSYRTHYMQGTGSSVVSGDYGSVSGVYVQDLGGSWDSNTSYIYAASIVDMLDVFSSTKNTTVRSITGVRRAQINSGVWFKTDAVTSLVISNDAANFMAGSRFSLYGIRG